MAKLEALTLLFVYLTAWDENPEREYGDKPILRAWKGYNFDVLDALQEKGFVAFSRKAKSLRLTEEGIERAKEIWQSLESKLSMI